MRRLLLLFIGIFSLFGVTRVETLPAPTEWTVDDSKMYARDSLLAWQHNQWLCLDKLWTKESNWRHEAYNRQTTSGSRVNMIDSDIKLEKDAIWAAKIAKSDVGNMDEAMISRMIVELNVTFQKICWDYGIHN